MTTFHTELQQKWHQYSLVEQMANIGAEVGRSINWRKKNNKVQSLNAFYRSLELVDFTIADKKNIDRLSEIVRMREILVDYFVCNNDYNSTDVLWEKYFSFFNLAARRDC